MKTGKSGKHKEIKRIQETGYEDKVKKTVFENLVKLKSLRQGMAEKISSSSKSFYLLKCYFFFAWLEYIAVLQSEIWKQKNLIVIITLTR